MAQNDTRLFSALLKYWRGRRGFSQLDLSLAADTSSRHVSFLETGRARPSREMVLRLGDTLGVPLRDQNAMLQAAGYGAEFAEREPGQALPASIDGALTRMARQHEPFPLIVFNRSYDLVRANDGATRLFSAVVDDPQAWQPPANIFHLLFDPGLGRPYVVNWERTARRMLSRLHRESLMRPDDEALRDLVRALFEYPGVPEEWRRPDFSEPTEPVLTLHVRRDSLELRFLITLTVFSAPQDVTLEELRIESYFPLDDATEQTCRQLARREPI